MKDEIKEILQLIGSCCYYGSISEDKCEKYCNYITNLQEENRQIKLLKERYQLEKENYKSRNEKAINEIIRVLQIILEQPSKDKLDDLWIINRLEGIQTLLQGDDNSE